MKSPYGYAHGGLPYRVSMPFRTRREKLVSKDLFILAEAAFVDVDKKNDVVHGYFFPLEVHSVEKALEPHIKELLDSLCRPWKFEALEVSRCCQDEQNSGGYKFKSLFDITGSFTYLSKDEIPWGSSSAKPTNFCALFDSKRKMILRFGDDEIAISHNPLRMGDGETFDEDREHDDDDDF